MSTCNKVASEDAPSYAANTVSDEERLILAQASAILFRQMERGQLMSDPEAAGQYCAMQLHGEEREVFGVLLLDCRHRAIAFDKLFFGGLTGSEVHPREVVKAALRHNAAAAIITHNHPSGGPDPSAADRAVTTRLKQALALVDVRLLDHFVVAPGAQPVSFAARGLL